MKQLNLFNKELPERVELSHYRLGYYVSYDTCSKETENNDYDRWLYLHNDGEWYNCAIMYVELMYIEFHSGEIASQAFFDTEKEALDNFWKYGLPK
jgi:hypothetical protein